MSSGVLSNPARWRAFADAVALALGINIWISVIVLPGFFVGARTSGGDILLAGSPLVVLGAGLWLRAEAVLLLAFPSALMVPVALAPEIVSAHVYGPVRFVLVAVGLVAYLLGVSFFTSFYEPAPPAGVRPLSSSRRPVPVRWRRRNRVYRALVILSAVFPAVLLYTVNFDSTSQEFLRQMYPGRSARMTAVLNLAVMAAWAFLYVYAFLSVLRHHRTGDRELTFELGRARVEAQSGKPRPAFYLGVLCALGLMILLLFGRYT